MGTINNIELTDKDGYPDETREKFRAIKPVILFGLLIARSLLCFLGQVITAGIFWLQGDPEPWMASVPYWNVFGTFADIGCILLLIYFLRKEGCSIWDLMRVGNIPLWRDILIGVGLFLLLFPVAIIGVTILANVLIYGTIEPDLGTGLLTGRQLPAWALFHSLFIWWVIWSATESTFYNGYLFPRFEALTGKTWVAVAIVGFFWALQHIFFPFIPDGKYLIWRFLQFLPIGLLMPFLFARLRRLRPLIIAHWLMDIAGVVLTIEF
ncbi:MAG: CPBP family intramembrane metalloprotease [Marinilabiliales bacterium]|nr:MAG: CPBP family intramembrane metalloprotease [Marinilabiliales bacterium]